MVKNYKYNYKQEQKRKQLDEEKFAALCQQNGVDDSGNFLKCKQDPKTFILKLDMFPVSKEFFNTLARSAIRSLQRLVPFL